MLTAQHQVGSARSVHRGNTRELPIQSNRAQEGRASDLTSPATRAAQATRIMQQVRSGPIQLRALAEELDARQEANCQKREIDLVHDPPAQPDERQKYHRSGETSQ